MRVYLARKKLNNLKGERMIKMFGGVVLPSSPLNKGNNQYDSQHKLSNNLS